MVSPGSSPAGSGIAVSWATVVVTRAWPCHLRLQPDLWRYVRPEPRLVGLAEEANKMLCGMHFDGGGEEGRWCRLALNRTCQLRCHGAC